MNLKDQMQQTKKKATPAMKENTLIKSIINKNGFAYKSFSKQERQVLLSQFIRSAKKNFKDRFNQLLD